MKSHKVCFSFILVLFLLSCSNDHDLDQEFRISEKAASLVETDNLFGLDLFRNVITYETKAENLMISPLSVALALAMTWNGSAGQTRTDMEKALRLKGLTSEEINESYRSLVNALQSVDPKVLLEIANSIYYRKDFTVEENFISLNRKYYNAEISPLDFSSPTAVNTVNGWVDTNTHGKIKTILDQITPDQVMFLLNAIYFKGIWKKEFRAENTRPYSFTTGNGTTQTVPMMTRSDTVEYCANDIFRAIRLPYGKGTYNMLLFLPETGRSVKDIEARLDHDNWKSWMKEFLPAQPVDIRLPKFKFGYDIKLNDILKDMGMGIAFTGAADFTGINRAGGLRIDYVKHKTFVEVNEEGTEAAAVTIVAIEKTMAGPSKIPFYVDKPFIFAITEKNTGAILFIGKVTDPLKS